MKPFRVLSAHHLELIRQRFIALFASWNKEYASTELTFWLEKCLETPEKLTCIHPSILADSAWITLLQACLFQSDEDCYREVSRRIGEKLCQALTGSESRVQIPTSWDSQDWFYPGSSCLKLTLYCNQQHSILYLHPDWVFRQLPKNKASLKPLQPFQHAIQEEKVTLTVLLNTTKIPFSMLLDLQPGNLLQTDHLLSEPVKLYSANMPIAEVDTLQQEHTKSITIRKFS